MKKKLSNFENLQKIAFFSKNFYVILFFTLQIFYNIFCNFQKFTPKEIFELKFFFAKIKFLTQYQSKFLCNVLLKTLQIPSYKLFYFS